MLKELVVVSGKGGTGKTTLASSFAYLSENKVIADCDVDASDMHLILQPEIKQVKPYTGRKKAKVIEEECTLCGICVDECRFDAITDINQINPIKCEGCGVCKIVCPVDAIEMVPTQAGELYLSESRYGPLIHARLFPGEENSGQLVSLVRQFAKITCGTKNKDLVIIDGPPGTGCPVTSAITGTNLAVVVTEPTLSGIHDLERVVEVIRQFKIKPTVVINKYDINPEMTEKIENFARENEILLLGKIPFDERAVESVVDRKSVPEYCDCELSEIIKEIWEKAFSLLREVVDESGA